MLAKKTPTRTIKATNGHKQAESLEDFEDSVLRPNTQKSGGDNQRLENLRQAIDSVFQTDNLRLRTSLNDEQIAALARAEIYANRYNSDVMRELIKVVMELQVSGNQGRGRNDMVEALRATIVTTEIEEGKSSTLRKRLLGF